MMNRHLYIALLLSILAHSLSGQVIQDSVKSERSTVFEKVYLHIDRQLYAPRETIWLKAYVVSGINHTLLCGHKNLYVQLIDEAGKVFRDLLLLTEDGMASGEFRLPYIMKEGQYTIRAYTKYLENFGEEHYFQKKIWVSRSVREQEEDTQDIYEKEIDVGFYPESGNLLMNSANRIAFKVVDSHGRGVAVNGTIIDETGTVVTPFSTTYKGMGSFIMMPKQGKTYKALLVDYPEFSYTFEPAVEDGAIFQFIDNGATVSFLIGRNFLAEGKRTYFINATHKGVSLFNEKFESLDYQLEVMFSKARFPLGISKITLIDESMKIVAERLIFIKVEGNDLIKIETDKQEYSKRSKVVTKILSNLSVGDSINAPPSVAIVNKDYLINGGYTQDMRSYLLLDSELKGPVESPASYFYDDEGISSSDKLDLLLMVQGWRSYSWNDILERQPEDLLGWEDIGFTLKGYVKRLFRKAPLPGAKVEVSPFSATWMFDWMYTDSLGQFRFDRLYLPDTMKIVINASTPRGGNNTEIILDPVMPLPVEVNPKTISDNLLDLEIPEEFYSESFYKLEAEKRYAIESGSVWLDEVEVITDIPEELDRSMGYYGFPDKTIVLTDEDRIYFNIFDYLESNPVAGVLVQGNTISIRGGGTPLFVVDGIIDEMGMFIDMPLGDIERIEVIKNSGGMAAFGSRGGNGIIAIYTQKGRINNTYEPYTWGRLDVEIIGFHEPARFYSPHYTLENINDTKPDYRPTLYWNPNLEMIDGIASIEYFTSDFICDYVIILEGVTDKGKICTSVGEFSVTQ